MSRSAAPLLVVVGLALASSAAPAVAQRSETIARGASRDPASDTAGARLGSLERSIDSLVRIFQDETLTPERRFGLRREIDGRFAEFMALRAAASPRPSERNVFIRRAPVSGFASGFGDDAASILPRLAQAGMVPGWIGIVVSGAPTQIRVENNEMFLRYLIYPEIASVDPSSPAQRAGLTPGDTLMAYNGRDVRAEEISMTRLLVPRATVRVRVRREGKVKELPVVVADAPPRIRLRREDELRGLAPPMIAMAPSPMIPRTPPVPSSAPTARAYLPTPPGARPMRSVPAIASLPPVFGVTPSGVAGAQVATVSEAMKRNLGLPAGVLVTTVPVGSPAGESGLQEGDVILRVAKQRVTLVYELRNAVARAAERGESSVELDVRRGRVRRTLTLRWRSS